MSCIMPKGAFYAFANVKDIFGRELRGKKINDGLDLANILLDEVQVAVVPGEAFGAPGYLRFGYALSDADITEALERIAKLLAE